jgi:hypothetical protein
MADVYPFLAGEDIGAYRIVSWANGVDGVVLAGHSGVDTVTLLAGVTGELATAAGEVADVTIGGVAEVQLGGTVKQFDVLTKDSNSKAITATASTVSLLQTVGMALMGGVSGDIIKINVNPGRLEKV